MTGDTGEQAFNPSLWRQRRTFILQILSEHSVTSILDYGCGRGAVLSVLTSPVGCVEGVVRLAGVDISSEALDECTKACEPWTADYENLRENPLEITLYKGNVGIADERLADFEAIICSEVIEHLDSPDLDQILRVVLHDYRPKVLVVTTPNAEYNINFPDLNYGTDKSEFRHDDHRFEWTRSEFETWCREGANEHGYQVEFHGIGRMNSPVSELDVGGCTQACVFTKSPVTNHIAMVQKRPHELFKHIEFPWYNTPDKEAHEIIQELNEIILNISPISGPSPECSPQTPSEWCETWSWDQLSQTPSVLTSNETKQMNHLDFRNNITVEELWSILRVRQLCRTRERLRHIMRRADFEMRTHLANE